ncbi:CDP-alcohol phosphatidyltransferase family protein [Aciditerrimonas ferrireducens]|nr:CDP-alcohol phosphatidyltransferase family protein [Aciditerrimonas ferrireducens]MCK4177222.1 CDP-alcohol phosphatidyltransferase family protein [Aciditerrimonas ferrireducens]
MGRALVRFRVTADVLTGCGLLLAGVAAVVIGTGHLAWGIVAMVGSGLPDLFDGPVAKASGTSSRRGAFFDSVADRVADFALYGGVAWDLAATHHGTAVLVPFGLAAAASVVSYERAKAELLGIPARGGLMERAERFVALGICLLAGAVDGGLLVPFLVGFLVLVGATALGRFVRVWRAAGGAVADEAHETPRPVQAPIPAPATAVPAPGGALDRHRPGEELLGGSWWPGVLGSGRGVPRRRLESRWRAWRARRHEEGRTRPASARGPRSAGWRAGGAEPARRWRLRRSEPAAGRTRQRTLRQRTSRQGTARTARRSWGRVGQPSGR